MYRFGNDRIGATADERLPMVDEDNDSETKSPTVALPWKPSRTASIWCLTLPSIVFFLLAMIAFCFRGLYLPSSVRVDPSENGSLPVTVPRPSHRAFLTYHDFLFNGDNDDMSRTHHESSQSALVYRSDEHLWWRQKRKQPIAVSYNSRAITLNNASTLLIGASVHPVRHTPSSWEYTLQHAVTSGVNLITVYVFWDHHQRFSSQSPYDWTIATVLDASENSSAAATSNWTLADALWTAAISYGMFIHIRIGPYTCAEYSYGGIPEWVMLENPDNMTLRRPNVAWYEATQAYVGNVTQYLLDHGLWANQGGPIILGQIENELGGSVDPVADAPLISPDATLQDYADWCGSLVDRQNRGDTSMDDAAGLGGAVWTMCFGLSAPNTINTFNGVDGGDSWLYQHGETGRIQVDQPAMWTEMEGKHPCFTS
jgi:Glycosyl hydrolases family 35